VIDLQAAMTQAAFGGMVGITQQAVSDLVQRGVLRQGDAAGVWLLAYCEQLRQVAAGRDPDGELSTERARLARETADKVAMANAVTRREFAPVAALEVVLADVARQVSTRLDALVPHIKRRLPDLPASVLTQISAEIHACRELCAAANLSDADRISSAGDDEDQADLPLAAPAEGAVT
jgi:phage terminase Nu1 subunit (DNA packaging protein)